MKDSIVITDIVKTYLMGDTIVRALAGVSLTIETGEFTAIMGPSGSGTSTLMNILGCLDRPTSGSYKLDGAEVATLGDDELAVTRNKKIGFVFQAAYLIPFLSVIDNVAILPMLAGKSNAEARSRAMELLQILEVDHRSHAKPSQLSGGEQQRVAIARAMANRPPFILADEPTAPLDSERSLTVIRLLTRLAEEYNTAIMVVTHDEVIIPKFKRLYRLRDGIGHEEQRM